MEHKKPNWDKLQAISVLTSDSPKQGPALKKNPYIYIHIYIYIYIYVSRERERESNLMVIQ